MIDRNDATWRQVEAWASTRISELNIENASDLDPQETAKVRGKIEMAKELLKLGEHTAPLEVADVNYL